MTGANAAEIRAFPARNLTPAQLAYVAALAAEGPNAFIDNIPPSVDYGLVHHDGWALPFTASHEEALAFPISPKTCYFAYPLLIEERDYGRGDAPLARFILKRLKRLVRFDRVVVLNNWFITNNPTPSFSVDALAAFLAALTERYPDYLVILKSVPETDPTGVMPALRRAGFDLINWRVCHYWNPSGPLASKRTKQFRSDRKILERTALRTGYAEAMSDEDARSCERLYRRLYIDKHTAMNVELNARWFQLTCNTGFADYFMARDAAAVKAFALSYADPIGINTGFLGYDLEDGRELGLYRMAFISKILKGIDANRTVNLSTGVSKFKENRGCLPYCEYEGVYARHLKLQTRLLMGAFIRAFNKYGGAIRCR